MTTVEILAVTPDPTLDPAPSAALARHLEAEGWPVRGRRVLAAEDGLAERALREAIAAGGLVVAVGQGDGVEALRQALAHVLESRLVLSPRAFEAVAAAYAERGQAMPRRAEALALVPQAATVLVATAGGEPGLLAETPGALVALLPGDEAVALAMLREHVLPRLRRRAAEPAVLVRTLRLVGLDVGRTEAELAGVLRDVEGVSGRCLEVDGEVWVRLRLRAATAAAAAGLSAQVEPELRGAFGAAWYGGEDETLEVVVGRLPRARGLTVALAESCTGGLVGHRLTQVPGSSTYFERGVVVYSNAAKQALLGVPERVLAEHGAVSAACAEAMAGGVRRQAGTDLGVSVTGIAGPDGGTPTKPVGLVFIGLADRETAVAHRFRFDRDRAGNKALSATMALDLIRRYCLERP